MAFTDKDVAELKPEQSCMCYPDPQLPGHYIRVMPSGSNLM